MLLEKLELYVKEGKKRQSHLTNLMMKKNLVTASQAHAEKEKEKIHCITRAQALFPPLHHVSFIVFIQCG